MGNVNGSCAPKGKNKISKRETESLKTAKSINDSTKYSEADNLKSNTNVKVTNLESVGEGDDYISMKRKTFHYNPPYQAYVSNLNEESARDPGFEKVKFSTLKRSYSDPGQYQWVDFSVETFSRVDHGVKELPLKPPKHAKDVRIVKSLTRSSAQAQTQKHANIVIESLNSSSIIAHIESIGLTVIPSISRFSSLRSVNLSGNFIVNISPGSLPKGLQILNLSRNKIQTIEGLRDISRLRVLDLSYNRISRIGQGLSNATLLKELYLGGNKISEIEGLHRHKLTILDLSFNKITTKNTLGQLVANYNSMVALNLVGNPILSNISEDQLRKTLFSFLPKLAWLNKQPVIAEKKQVIKGGGKAVKRVSRGGSSKSNVHTTRAHIAHRSKVQRTHHSSLKKSA